MTLSLRFCTRRQLITGSIEPLGSCLISDRCFEHRARAAQRNIGAVIKATGYRWKQARVTLTSTDPNYRDKLNRIRSTLSRLAPEEAGNSRRIK